MTPRYHAILRHYSIAQSAHYALRATTDRGARRAAWRALGDGFSGHTIVVYRGDPGSLDAAEIGVRTIGVRGGRWA